MIPDSFFQLRRPLSILLALTSAFLILRILLYFIFPSNIATKLTDLTNTQEDGPSEISLLSWNIWFGRFKMAERMIALGDVIDQMRPDIIALQEVTRDSMALLKQQSWYRRYNLVPSEITSEGSYFVVIFSVFPVQKWKGHPFQNSHMGRKLITANVEVKRHLFINVGTSHLESLAPHTLQREAQLRDALNILSRSENACLMGDLNLEGSIDGEIMLPYPWFDAWLSLHSEKNGYTWNPTINTMLENVSDNARERFDRVFCRLRDFKVKKIIIVGNQPAKNGVFPSDHFGLYTVLGSVKREKYSYQQARSRNQKHLQFRRPQGHTH